MGSMLVWSAGNDSRLLQEGDRDDDALIVVGATDINDQIADFSARGPFVDFVGPGVDVFTTAPGGEFQAVTGTSFSAPLAAGLAALIWSNAPDFTPKQVEDALKQGVDDLGDSGVDDRFGFGRINTAGSLGFEQLVRFSFPAGQPDFISPSGGDPVRVRIEAAAANPLPNSATLHLGIDGSFTPIAMSNIGGGLYEGAFPPVPCLSDVRYFISVDTDRGDEATFPFAAPTFTFEAESVVDLQAPAVFTMEDPEGWTVEDSSGLLSGSWAIGIVETNPLVDGDPAEDVDGSGSAWLTGVPNADPDQPVQRDTDVDEGSTTLITPPIDLSSIAGFEGRLTLRYSIYFLDGSELGLPRGDVGGEFLVEITDDGSNWQTLEFVPASTVFTDRDQQARWVDRAFVLDDSFDRSGVVQLRFTATNLTPLEDLFGDTFGEKTEAAVDALAFVFERCSGTAPCSEADVVAPFGELTGADLEASVELATGGGPFGDFNGSGTTNVFDVLDYLGVFADGCP